MSDDTILTILYLFNVFLASYAVFFTVMCIIEYIYYRKAKKKYKQDK